MKLKHCCRVVPRGVSPELIAEENFTITLELVIELIKAIEHEFKPESVSDFHDGCFNLNTHSTVIVDFGSHI